MQDKEQYKELLLPNGLKVCLYPIETLMSVYAIAKIRTGAIFEKENERGISHFVEHAAFLGTNQFPTQKDLGVYAENNGISYSGATGNHFTDYTTYSPYTNLEKSLGLLYELIFESKLDEESVLKEKQVILSEYNDFWHTPERRFEQEFWRKRFSWENHPYSWRPMGTPETVRKLNISDIMKWRKKYYTPTNMVLCIVGNFKISEIENVIIKTFGPLKKGIKHEEPKFSSNDYSDFNLYYLSDKRPQITFGLSFPSFGFRETERKDWFKVRLLNQVLGGMRTSRLHSRLREKERMVYKVGSFYTFHSWMGGLEITGAVPVEKLPTAIELTKEETLKLKNSGITTKELECAKNRLSYSIMMAFDNPESVARDISGQVFDDLEVWFPKQTIKMIKEIKKEEVEGLAERIFDFSKINIGLLGNVRQETIQEIDNIFRN